MRIAIVGSRNYKKLEKVDEKLNHLKEAHGQELEIITGGAIGVDQKAMEWAAKNNIRCEVVRPIKVDDKFSYLLRNVEIITKSDMVIAFWDGESRGTKFTIDYAKVRDKKNSIIF